MLGPVAVLVWGYADGGPLRELAAGGRVATGGVTEKYTRPDRTAVTRHHVRYTFPADGQPYSADDEIEPEEFEAYAPGKPCMVTYLPGRPEVHCLGDARALLGDRSGGVVYFALAVAGVLGLVYAVLALVMRHELRLVRVGEPVAGRVTEVGVRDDDGTQRHWASYHFAGPDGGRYTGQNDVPRSVWGHLYAGIRVLILQDPDHPGRHRPLYAFRHAFIDISPPAEGAAEDATAGHEA
jgi:hypothetical protein